MSVSQSILKAVLFTPGLNGRWGLPVLFAGGSGVAKSSVVEQAAKRYGLDLHVLVGSVREPSDFAGFPVRGEVGMEYAAPKWAVQAATAPGGRALVFLDELSTSAPAVQAAMLRLVLDGVCGEYELPDGVRFIAAMNPPELAAGGWDLSPPMANRFGHMAWATPDISAWAAYMTGGAADPSAEGEDSVSAEALEAYVLREWPAAYARAVGLVAGFLHRMPDRFYKQPLPGDPKGSGAWPSPRSWSMMTRALAGSFVHRLSDVDRDELLMAFVGEPAAEFVHWMTEADLPEPVKLLAACRKHADGEGALAPEVKAMFVHSGARLDRTFAVIQSSVSYLRGCAKSAVTDAAIGLWTLLDAVSAEAPDLAVLGASVLVRDQGSLGIDSQVLLHARARAVLRASQGTLSAA